MPPHARTIAVIGLGYVGLPVASAFAARVPTVIGFDLDEMRIAELRDGVGPDARSRAGASAQPTSALHRAAARHRAANFFIVTVPTPIDAARRPDSRPCSRRPRRSASALKRGDIVVYESTVYPGATRGGLRAGAGTRLRPRCGQDFTVGYSPERINPGDKEHRFETIIKIVSGQDAGDAGHRRRRLRFGGHRRRSPRRPRLAWPRRPRSSRTRSAISTSPS